MQDEEPAPSPGAARTFWPRLWKSVISGLCGSGASAVLMYFKARAGILPSFQPYEHFQAVAAKLLPPDVHPDLLWLGSLVNGSTVVGLIFSAAYRYLPGDGGVSRGLVFGACGWLVMNMLAFPLVGLGIFATEIGLGAWPALFSLAMLSTYSMTMGLTYAALERPPRCRAAKPGDGPTASS